MRVCENAYQIVSAAPNKILAYQEAFQSIPRPVLNAFTNSELLPDFLNHNFMLKNAEINKEKLLELNINVDFLNNELRLLRNSKSWKITKPLRQLFRKLKVYKGSDHPHQAQKPQLLKIDSTAFSK